MAKITAQFPFPPPELNPNKRLHWAAKLKVKEKQRNIGYDQGVIHRDVFDKKCHIALTLRFYPPTKRHYDLDNGLAALKQCLDGFAMGLDVNDRQFRPIILYMEESDKDNPRVEATLDLADKHQ